MANILNEVSFGIMSLKDFESKDLAQSVLSTIADAGPFFFPTVYDVYEPLPANNSCLLMGISS